MGSVSKEVISTAAMNGRERMGAIYGGEKPDYLPPGGVGPWVETLDRWYAEGLPNGADPNVELGLVSDDCTGLPLNLHMVPLLSVRVLKI